MPRWKYHRKEQDELDERASANGIVIVGDTYRIEKRHASEQISDVARRKKHQYINGAFNILVIDSSSESMEPADIMVRTGVGCMTRSVAKLRTTWRCGGYTALG